MTKTLLNTITITKVIKPSIIEFLDRREYYNKALSLIKNANNSIYLLMFVAKYDPRDPEDPANDLLIAICRAKERGLTVKVVLDEETMKAYSETIELLREHNVSIKIWKGRATMHAKILIIDNKHVLIGSHNWTESGLWYNIEASIYTTDTEAVDEAKKLFEYVWMKASQVT